MFNNSYGIVNYLGVDLLHLYDTAPLWFDNPGSSFVLVVLFAILALLPVCIYLVSRDLTSD